jgi:hypothetical protein
MDEINSQIADSPEDAAGWDLVAAYDGAAAVISVALSLEEAERLSRKELCERSSVPYKTLYLSDTIDELVEAGVLSKNEAEGAETEFGCNHANPAVEAAKAFAGAFEETA